MRKIKGGGGESRPVFLDHKKKELEVLTDGPLLKSLGDSIMVGNDNYCLRLNEFEVNE